MIYTSDKLIERITRIAGIPEQQPAYTSEELHDFINEEIRQNLVPMLVSMNEDYFVVLEYFDIPSDIQKGIRLPARVTGSRIRDIKISAESTPTTNNFIDIPRVQIEDLDIASKTGYYLKGTRLFFVDPSSFSASWKLAIWYYRRPNEVRPQEECALISAIDIATNTVTCTSIPPTWNTSSVVDFIQGNPHFEIIDTEYVPVSISGNEIIFSALPEDLAMGDWIALKGETPIPNIPLEAHDLLIYAVATKIMAALSSPEELQQATATMAGVERNVRKLLTPRIDGDPPVICNWGLM